ncbi:MAG: acylphosphatase [Flavobacteriaceae bacterium]|nr:acylphosphatase [Flavobacteriaceae bacterium]
MDFNHYSITISGRVQGVWFRKYARDKALELGLKGFIRNEFNGDVYAEAEGSSDELHLFIDWLRIGSPLSQVENVAFEPGELKHFSGFEIRR